MSDKREISFDILENTDIETVEKLERDVPMVSENDKNRILEMSLKKFEDGRNKAAKSDNINENIDEIEVELNNKEIIVSGVEKYSKPKMSKTVAAFAGTAAALAIIISGIWVLSPESNNKLDEPMQSSSLASSDASSSQKEIPSKTTLRYAQDRVLENLSEQIYNYSLYDVNMDDIPEFIVTYKTSSNNYITDFYYFNGTDYVCDITFATDTDKIVEIRGDIKCNEAENLIWCKYPDNFDNVVYKMNSDNTFDIMGDFENNDEFITSRKWVDFSYEGTNSKTWTEDNKPTKAMLEAARNNALAAVNGKNIEYACVDVNMDGVDELIVSADDLSQKRSYMLFYYNGKEYTCRIYPSESSLTDGMPFVIEGKIKCLPEENLLWCYDSELSDSEVVLKMNENNKFEVVAFGEKDVESFENKNWIDVKFKPYAFNGTKVIEIPDLVAEELSPESAEAMSRLLESTFATKDVYLALNLCCVNADNIPELIVTYQDMFGNSVSDFYYFNGTDYVQDISNASDTNTKLTLHGDIKCNGIENLIWCKNPHMEGNLVLKMNVDNTYEEVGTFEDDDEFFTSREWADFEFSYSEAGAPFLSVHSLEIHDAARNRLFETLSANTHSSIVEYSYCDINTDGTPELIIILENMSGNRFSNLYYFNGTDYINASGKTPSGVTAQITGDFHINPYEKLIWCEQRENGENIVYRMDENNKFELIDTFKKPDENDPDSKRGSLYNYYSNKDWLAIEFTPYK